jgi:hypothetical protein
MLSMRHHYLFGKKKKRAQCERGTRRVRKRLILRNDRF